jgi:aspartate-semialdehyde dehydrogenase
VDRTPASPVVLSALPGRVARDVEVRLANEGRLVSSNASVHRMRPDVPLMVPEVNPGALSLAEAQPWRRSGGVLVCNPNCVATGVSLALAPLHRRWGIGEVVMVTLQALSGAGLGGPSALSMTGNVIPWIEGEEEKIPGELGRLLGGAFPVAVAANRVPVADGHTAHVFLRFDRRAGAAEVAAELRRSGRGEAAVSLPTLPDRSLVVVDGADRPQPLLDAGRSGGMKVSVGRVRSAPPSDVAMVVVSHNAVRGAAGACLANAELCVARGLGPEGASAAL